MDWRHEMKLLLASYLRRAGIQHRCEVRGPFQHCVQQDGGAGGRQRRYQGLIPDFVVKMHAQAHRELMDVKCITVCKSNHTRACLWRGVRGEVVRKYAKRVHQQYVTKARKFDKAHNGAAVEAELTGWPKVRGLVFGAYGGVSESVEKLVKTCAQAVAEKEWRVEVGARTKEEAYNRLVDAMCRQVGVLAVRSHAELKLKRVKWAVSGADTAGDKAAARRRAGARVAHADRNEVYHAVHSTASTAVPAALRHIWRQRGRQGVRGRAVVAADESGQGEQSPCENPASL